MWSMGIWDSFQQLNDGKYFERLINFLGLGGELTLK